MTEVYTYEVKVNLKIDTLLNKEQLHYFLSYLLGDTHELLEAGDTSEHLSVDRSPIEINQIAERKVRE